MSPNTSPESSPWRAVWPMAALLLLAAIGIFALLYFWTQLLKPGNLGTLSLPVVAFVAGLAATFNPCALPALPAFLTLMSAGDMPSPTSSRMQRKTRGGNLGRSRLALDLSTGLGAIALVLLLGLLVSLLGESTKAFVRDNFRWVQLSVGLFLVVIAGLHLLGQTTRLPFVAPLVAKGHQIWEDAVRDPSPRGGFLFGAGYVLVGVGWTGPFLAAVAVFALGLGGFSEALLAFVIFALTMGGFVTLVSLLGAVSGPLLAKSLRRYGRYLQVVSGWVIVLTGAALIYASFNPGFFDSLILN